MKWPDAIAIAAFAVMMSLGMILIFLSGESRIPFCPEDSVLIGVGQFEEGSWDHYMCGPARDDYNK